MDKMKELFLLKYIKDRRSWLNRRKRILTAITGLPQSWKVLELEKGPGKSWNFTYFCRKSWKGPGILYSSFFF